MDYFYKDELREACEAADAALDRLLTAKQYLNKAAGWGIFDMLGGGLIASLMKRNRMQECQRALDDAKDALFELQNELGDLDLDEIGINNDDFLSFTDVFFDNIFSDILTQRKINNALDDVEDVIERVSDLRLDLYQRYEEADY